ncbi:MAG TPA: adenylate/guanylate cyclase domain-containing protein, partial [Anaerolineales bacterium]|nr:adenylate/guanylate cyclase domain-containing protein [Anaerolineales bacterium]
MTIPLVQHYPEERRLASVLFADVQGFTTLADHMDFEDVSDLMREVWALVDQVIETHGGYIDKHIGDAVMAVWGAPHASEDDAERAVLAAMAMHTAVGHYAENSPREGANQLKMRVGVNTGPVLAGYV